MEEYLIEAEHNRSYRVKGRLSIKDGCALIDDNRGVVAVFGVDVWHRASRIGLDGDCEVEIIENRELN